MALPILMIVLGLIVLVWSADLFVDGAAALAKHWGMPTLLIGMLVVGFGTAIRYVPSTGSTLVLQPGTSRFRLAEEAFSAELTLYGSARVPAAFEDAMDDNLNIAEALGAVFAIRAGWKHGDGRRRIPSGR